VITIKIILDDERPLAKRAFIEAFKEFILDFEKLSSFINKATTLIKINNKSTFKSRAFVKDVLSIEIENQSKS